MNEFGKPAVNLRDIPLSSLTPEGLRIYNKLQTSRITDGRVIDAITRLIFAENYQEAENLLAKHGK